MSNLSPSGINIMNRMSLKDSSDSSKGAHLVGYRGRSVRTKLDDVWSPEDFGATGLDEDKDTSAFLAMLSSGETTFMPVAQRRYKIASNLDLSTVPGMTTNWLNPLLIECRTNDAGQHDALIVVEGVHNFQGIDVLIPSGIRRRGIISDDFYGGVKSYRKEFKTSYLRMNSVDGQSDYTGSGAAAVKLANQDYVHIGPISSDEFRRVMSINDCQRVELGWQVLNNIQRGTQILRCHNVRSDGGVFHGTTTDKTTVADSNAMLILASNHVSVGDLYSYDAGEHGFRITAADIEDVGEQGGNISIGHVSVIRAGACGFKAHGGTNVDARIRNLNIRSLYVEDSGFNLYAPGIEPSVGTNHFALNVQETDNFSLGSFKSRKILGQYNGTNIMMFRSVTNISIPDVDGSGAFGNGIFTNSGQDFGDWYIKGRLTDCGNGTGNSPAMSLLGMNYATRVRIEMDVFSCPGILNLNPYSGAARGSIDIRGVYDGITGTMFPNTLERTNVVVDYRSPTWPTSGGSYYPVGTTLMAVSDSNSNSAVGTRFNVYVSAVSSIRFVAVRDGQTPVESVGLQLEGRLLSDVIIDGVTHTPLRLTTAGFVSCSYRNVWIKNCFFRMTATDNNSPRGLLSRNWGSLFVSNTDLVFEIPSPGITQCDAINIGESGNIYGDVRIHIRGSNPLRYLFLGQTTQTGYCDVEISLFGDGSYGSIYDTATWYNGVIKSYVLKDYRSGVPNVISRNKMGTDLSQLSQGASRTRPRSNNQYTMYKSDDNTLVIETMSSDGSTIKSATIPLT